jgi:hypothetical protein
MASMDAEESNFLLRTSLLHPSLMTSLQKYHSVAELGDTRKDTSNFGGRVVLLAKLLNHYIKPDGPSRR